LHIAVIENHAEVVRALVAAGSKKSLRDSGGFTARSLASKLHHVDLLELLMPESEKQARREGYCWRGRRRYYFKPGEPHPY
jgi:ankyrin repeat protein